jgi:hypothetical protein
VAFASWLGAIVHINGLQLRPAGPVARREPADTRAAIAALSPIKCAALVICLQGGGVLYKRSGVWSPTAAGELNERISGNSVADLARDGFLTITATGKHASARLTPRGEWLARTAAEILNPLGG